jgi:hypothetical protein
MKTPEIIEEIWWIENTNLSETAENGQSTKKEIKILKDSIVSNFYYVEGIWKFNNRTFIFDNGVEWVDEKWEHITVNGEKYYKYEEWINGKWYEHYISQDGVACLFIWNFIDGERGWEWIQFMNNWDKFEWSWNNGEAIKWTFTDLDWNKYEWDFKNHRFEWKWTYTYAEWDKYVWDFKNNDFEWMWVYTFVNWDKYEWNFKNGTYDWEWTLTWEKNWDVLTWEWKDGKCVSWKITLNQWNRIFDVTEDEKWLRITTPWEYEGKYTKEII